MIKLQLLLSSDLKVQANQHYSIFYLDVISVQVKVDVQEEYMGLTLNLQTLYVQLVMEYF
jgi:hypothetical protein